MGGHFVDLASAEPADLCVDRRPTVWTQGPATLNSWAWRQTIDSTLPQKPQRRPGGTRATRRVSRPDSCRPATHSALPPRPTRQSPRRNR